MMFIVTLILILPLWALFEFMAGRAKSDMVKALWRAIGPAIAFSPGLAVGHGAVVVPALIPLFLQSDLRGWHAISLGVVYVVATVIFYIHAHRLETR